MMRKRILVAVGVLFWAMVFSQARAGNTNTVTADDLDRVFAAISENNWKLAEAEIIPLIERSSQAQRYLIARLRYIYLFSLAVQVENKSLKYDDLQKKLSRLNNQMIVQPWHPISVESNSCFNQICATKDKPTVLRTVQANSDATQIYSFEYFDMGELIDVGSFNGQNARLGGTLENIEINKNLEKAIESGSGVTWFFKLSVKDGFLNYSR